MNEKFNPFVKILRISIWLNNNSEALRTVRSPYPTEHNVTKLLLERTKNVTEMPRYSKYDSPWFWADYNNFHL